MEERPSEKRERMEVVEGMVVADAEIGIPMTAIATVVAYKTCWFSPEKRARMEVDAEFEAGMTVDSVMAER